MKTIKALLLVCSMILAPLSAHAVDVQSSGPVSTIWTTNALTSVTGNFSLQSNPGDVFGSITFQLTLIVDDRDIQTLKPFGSILLVDGSNPAISLSTMYLRAGSNVDASLDPYDVLTDFVSENLPQNSASLGTTDNFLGISFMDINSQVHYGWLQFRLNSFSDGNVAAEFVAGSVNDTPNTAATAGGTVPEPSTLALLAAAGTGLALIARSRRK